MLVNKEKEFLEKVQPHKGIIYKVSRMYMDTPEDREDLVQEIMIRLWTSYGSFEGRSSFSTWMYRVSVNTAITFLRNEKRKPPTVIAEEPFLANKRDEVDSNAEEKLELFYKAVKQLNSIEKALIFYFMEGLPHREISQLLGISENNTRVKLNRIKEKIQIIIKQYGYEF